MPDELTPTTNIEKFLAKTAGESVELPEPATRIEKYLNKIASEQTITEATDNWLDEHIDPSTGYVLDSTLTMNNAAPPASAVGDLKSAITQIVYDGIITITKELTWVNAYVDATGLLKSSSLSQTCVVPMNAGETVTIGTLNTNITIIGSTSQNSVAVGDTVTVIQKTSSVSQYEEYSYTATEPINIVLCVLKSNYNLSFTKPLSVNNAVDKNTADIATFKDYVPKGITDGYVFGSVVANGIILSSGVEADRSNRIRTALIPFLSNDKIIIENGTLQHGCIMWNGEPSVSTVKRNDDSFSANTEIITPDYNGYIVIVFRKSDNSDLTINDFDGAIKLYNTLAYRNSVEINYQSPPSYYFVDEYISDKAERINQLGKLGDDVFTFITDIHWELNARHSPELISYLNRNCSIHKIFNNGDVANASVLDVYKKYRKSIDGKTYHVAGNHDWFSPTTGKDLYYCMDSVNNDQIGNPFMHYYYVDNVQQKIRYIILNSFTRDGSSTTITTGYDADQIAWFSSTALNLPSNDWDVIVFTHFLKASSYISRGDSIANAIDTFNANTSHTGKILAVFQGHAHWDAIYHTTAGVPIITTTCDKWDLSNESELAQEQPSRVLGTISEQAFDVVILNRAEQEFTCVRIGALAQNNIDKYRTDNDFEWIGTLEERVVSYA